MNEAPLLTSNSYLGFVPSMVVQHLLERKVNQIPANLPEKQTLRSVVMFADISGFTNLTETLSKKGPEGAEIIAFAINRYMELMIKEIGRSGGDIFKFAGDAMIVVWPPPKQNSHIANTCRQAIQAALSIQSKLDNMNIIDGVKLSVKIGFGVGEFSIIYVGGILGRAEYLPTGDPLNQAFLSEHAAESGGIINCSQQIYDLIHDHFITEIKDHDKKIYQITKVKTKVMVKADAMMIKDNLSGSEIESIKEEVLKFIPFSLQTYIQYDQEQWSSELRLVTILFMNIGIDLSDCQDLEGLNKIQNTIQNIQKCVYMLEGSLNKFLMDDKGSTLMVVFGLPPITHQDDAIRAIFCAYAIKAQLRSDNCKCSIGIGTGLVFAGVVGTTGNRREYSVIGDSVNLSARIMQKACMETDDKYKILCSEATMLQAQHKISFMFKEFEQFKGKEKLLPVYYPLNLDNKQINQIDRENKFPSLRTHVFSFPMNPDQKVKKMERFNYQRGMSKQLKEAEEFVWQFCNLSMKKGCLLIRGEIGIGKSLFLRKLIYGTQTNIEKHRNTIYKHNERISIIVSNVDALSRFKKMNIMRECLRRVIELLEQRAAQKESFKIEKFLDYRRFTNPKLQGEKLDQFIETFKEICNVTQINYVTSFPQPQTSGSEKDVKFFLKKEAKMLSALAIELFSQYFEEPLSKKHKNSTDSTNMKSSTELAQTKGRDFREEIAPIILCFDDLQNADIYSWRVLKDLIKIFSKIFIIGAVRDSSLEHLRFPQRGVSVQEKIIEEGISKISLKLKEVDIGSQYRSIDLFKTMELKPIQRDKFREIIRTIFNLEKVVLLTKGIPPRDQRVNDLEFSSPGLNNSPNSASIRPSSISKLSQVRGKAHTVFEEEFNNMLARFEKNEVSYLFFHQVKNHLIKEPDTFFHTFIFLKSRGNPLVAIHLVENLISQKLLLVKDLNFHQPTYERYSDGTFRLAAGEDPLHQAFSYSNLSLDFGYITPQLRQAIMLDELLTIDVPLCQLNVNTPIIDKMSCLEQLILKSASVIGDVFDLQTLQKVHPFGSVVKPDKLLEMMQNLEKQNFLEVVDQSQANVFYRFTLPFARETLYQRLIFTQRRQLHLIVAEAIQNYPSLPHNTENDIARLKYHWFLGENGTDISDIKLSHRAKRSIIIKRIQSQISENENSLVIKADYLEKKSDYSKYSWAKRYVVMNTRDIRYYYTVEDWKEKAEDYLGAIPLKSIYEVNMLDPNEYKRKDFPFRIQASTWYKKTRQQPKRDFFFTASTKEEYEEWYIYLNIAKAKAMQDEFQREYGQGAIINKQENDYIFQTYLERKQAVTAGQSPTSSPNSHKSMTASRSSLKHQSIKSKDKKNEEDLAASQLSLIQKQNQLVLQDKVSLFFKKGMNLFLSHLFKSAMTKCDNREEFGQGSCILDHLSDATGKMPSDLDLQSVNSSVYSDSDIIPKKRVTIIQNETSSFNTVTPSNQQRKSILVLKSASSNDPPQSLARGGGIKFPHLEQTTFSPQKNLSQKFDNIISGMHRDSPREKNYHKSNSVESRKDSLLFQMQQTGAKKDILHSQQQIIDEERKESFGEESQKDGIPETSLKIDANNPLDKGELKDRQRDYKNNKTTPLPEEIKGLNSRRGSDNSRRNSGNSKRDSLTKRDSLISKRDSLNSIQAFNNEKMLSGSSKKPSQANLLSSKDSVSVLSDFQKNYSLQVSESLIKTPRGREVDSPNSKQDQTKPTLKLSTFGIQEQDLLSPSKRGASQNDNTHGLTKRTAYQDFLDRNAQRISGINQALNFPNNKDPIPLLAILTPQGQALLNTSLRNSHSLDQNLPRKSILTNKSQISNRTLENKWKEAQLRNYSNKSEDVFEDDDIDKNERDAEGFYKKQSIFFDKQGSMVVRSRKYTGEEGNTGYSFSYNQSTFITKTYDNSNTNSQSNLLNKLIRNSSQLKLDFPQKTNLSSSSNIPPKQLTQTTQLTPLPVSPLNTTQQRTELVLTLKALTDAIPLKGENILQKDKQYIGKFLGGRKNKDVIVLSIDGQQSFFLRSNFEFVSHPEFNKNNTSKSAEDNKKIIEDSAWNDIQELCKQYLPPRAGSTCESSESDPDTQRQRQKSEISTLSSNTPSKLCIVEDPFKTASTSIQFF